MTDEKIYDVYWQGPFAWSDRSRIEQLRDPGSVIYALQGTHQLYGRDALLYIGKTETTVAARLEQHADSIEDEYDAVSIRVASIGEFANWDKYESWSVAEAHPRPSSPIIDGVEALLIYAHQPAYNNRGKGGLAAARGIRIYNTGKSGHVLPEMSFGYHHGYEATRRRAKRDV